MAGSGSGSGTSHLRALGAGGGGGASGGSSGYRGKGREHAAAGTEAGTGASAGAGAGTRERSTEGEPQMLARWMAETGTQPHSTGLPLWQLTDSPRFAALWYSARSAGEGVRAQALDMLYQQRPHPGGAHPDPRKPAAFSSRAILGAAARVLGITLWPVPEESARHVAPLDAFGAPALAWLFTYPRDRAFDLALRQMYDPHRVFFEVACLMGYALRERRRLEDSEGPAGVVLLPRDTGLQTVLHQFAIALLGLPEECPGGWPCACNQIRRRYNAPPPDHAQPTGELPAFRPTAAHLPVRKPPDRSGSGSGSGRSSPGSGSGPGSGSSR